MSDTAGAQLAQRLERVVSAQLEEAAVLAAHGRTGRDLAVPDHHAQRLRVVRGAVVPSGAQARVVGQGGAGADRDRVRAGSQAMAVPPGLGPGDPLAGAVGGGDAPVERLGDLGRHERTILSTGSIPPAVQRPGLLGQQPAAYLDTGGAEAPGSPGTGLGVLDGEDRPRDPGLQDGLAARTRASGVVAGLERHHDRGVEQVGSRRAGLGQDVGLGVRSARTQMPPHVQDPSLRIQQRRAHERIGAAGALQRGLERPLHGGGLGLGERRLDGHRRASSSAELSRTVTSGKAVSISTPEDSVPTGADPSRRWTRHQMKNPRRVKQP